VLLQRAESEMGIVHPGVPRRLALWLRDAAATRDFVETGTFLGGTARWAARHFERVISIEADQKLYGAARKRLASYANVDLRLGRSQDVLSTLIPDLSRTALVWLDAHWSCNGTAGEDAECPLLEEIEAVDSGKTQHLILIDDARFFFNPPPPPHKHEQWPSAGAVIDKLRTKFDGYVYATDDVILRLPIGLRDQFEAFLTPRSHAALRWMKTTILKPLLAPISAQF
jgi:hypothetical protein